MNAYEVHGLDAEEEIRLLAEEPGFLLFNMEYGLRMEGDTDALIAEAQAAGHPIKTTEMAVKCLQFVSVDGVEAARAYLRARKDPHRYCVHFLAGSLILAIGFLAWRRRFRLRHLIVAALLVAAVSSAPYVVLRVLERSPAPLLEEALVALAPKLQDNSADYWDTHRHGNLIGMLAELAPGTASRYAGSQCSAFLDAEDKEIEWQAMLSGHSKRGLLLEHILGTDPASLQRVVEKLGQLRGARLVDASYALCRLGVLGPDEIPLRVDEGSREACALGVYQAGKAWSDKWDWKKAKALIGPASQFAQRAEFREMVNRAKAWLKKR
jgi:hypothetical protein